MDFEKVESEFSRSKALLTENITHESRWFRETGVQVAKNDLDLIKFVVSLSVTLTAGALAVSQTDFFNFSATILGWSIFLFCIVIVLGIWMLKVEVQRSERTLREISKKTHKQLLKLLAICSEIISAAWDKDEQKVTSKMLEFGNARSDDNLSDALIGEEIILRGRPVFFIAFLSAVLLFVLSFSWSEISIFVSSILSC